MYKYREQRNYKFFICMVYMSFYLNKRAEKSYHGCFCMFIDFKLYIFWAYIEQFFLYFVYFCYDKLNSFTY